jgi:hypothetical protein
MPLKTSFKAYILRCIFTSVHKESVKMDLDQLLKAVSGTSTQTQSPIEKEMGLSIKGAPEKMVQSNTFEDLNSKLNKSVGDILSKF